MTPLARPSCVRFSLSVLCLLVGAFELLSCRAQGVKSRNCIKSIFRTATTIPLSLATAKEGITWQPSLLGLFLTQLLFFPSKSLLYNCRQKIRGARSGALPNGASSVCAPRKHSSTNSATHFRLKAIGCWCCCRCCCSNAKATSVLKARLIFSVGESRQSCLSSTR